MVVGIPAYFVLSWFFEGGKADRNETNAKGVIDGLRKGGVEKIYIEGKSQQEVSDALGVPLGTIKSRTRLALKKLKELIVNDD